MRSTGCGTNRVHQRLNAGRAMTLCWMANKPKQQGVDDQRRNQRPGFAAVDGLWHRQIADEGDGVEKRGQEHEIDEPTVQN